MKRFPFLFAVVYNILRFFRLAFPKMKKAAAVSDFLFTVTAPPESRFFTLVCVSPICLRRKSMSTVSSLTGISIYFFEAYSFIILWI